MMGKTWILRGMFWGTLWCAALASILCATGRAQESAAPHETAAQRDARMKWWREARFGLFIHWGVYSVPAGTYQGKQIAGPGEWIMNRGKIPMVEYQKFPAQFNPVKFNADAWVRLAKEAGMKYIVITSKHHDGFAMFNTKVDNWCITKATPFHRDPLQELAAACQKYGIKLGFYYSQAQDWNHPGGAASGGHWDKAQEGSMDDYVRNVAVPQVREILSNYGPIAVLWWDTPQDMTPERAEMLLPLLKLQPGIITNNRLCRDFPGDTETPEQFIPANGFPGHDWETCMTMNGTWGYKSYDDNWKSTETLIHNLINIASKGGNYLLNVGPTSEGLIPEPSVERLQAVGQWMKVNGESIYATTAGPFRRLPSSLRCTQKAAADGTTLYMHVLDWPQDGKLVIPGLKSPIESAWLLADPQKTPLSTQQEGSNAVISVPGSAPDPIASVVVLRMKDQKLDIETMPLGQEADGSLPLMPSDAECHGEKIRHLAAAKREFIGYWTKPADWVDWEFEITQPGKFAVTAEIGAEEGPASFQIVVGDQTIDAKSIKTGDYKRFKTAKLGTIQLSPGKHTLAVKAVAKGWRPVNLRAITLTPVK